jgi:hypothetical protein
MLVRELKERPLPGKSTGQTGRATTVHAIEWACDWTAYYLWHLGFSRSVEYLCSPVLIAIVFYFPKPATAEAKHYQAWQVISHRAGKGGSGGRIKLFRAEHGSHPLVGVDASAPFCGACSSPKRTCCAVTCMQPICAVIIWHASAVGEPSPQWPARFKA